MAKSVRHTKADLLERYNRLGSATAVAKEMGVHPSTAWIWLSKIGVPMKRGVRPMSPGEYLARHRELLADRRAKLSCVACAKKYGLSPGRVHEIEQIATDKGCF